MLHHMISESSECSRMRREKIFSEISETLSKKNTSDAFKNSLVFIVTRYIKVYRTQSRSISMNHFLLFLYESKKFWCFNSRTCKIKRYTVFMTTFIFTHDTTLYTESLI